MLGHATAASAAEPTAGYPEPVIQWGVQKGETCDDIAKVVYGSAKHVALLHRYNRIGCGPATPLPEGLTLVLPATVTSIPDARIKGAYPEVKAKPPGGAWVTAAPGMPLGSNASVNTLDAGRADIEFIDRTRLVLSPRTLVVIYGTASRSRVSRAPPAAVELEDGEVKAALSALRGGAGASGRASDRTPLATVEVDIKGGGRISASSRDTVVQRKGERTTVAVFDGKAGVSASGRTVEVPRNHGTRFTPATPPAPPRPLPPAPAWATGQGPDIFLTEGDAGVFTASWKPVPRATAYRVEIARDPDFNDLVAREEVAADVLAFRGERLPLGAYHLRVRAIDQEEYLGIAATRVGHLLQATQQGGQIGPRQIEASPYGVLRLGPSNALEMALDDGPYGPLVERLDLKQRQPEVIHLRARGGASDASPAEPTTIRLVYRPVTATIDAPQATPGVPLQILVRLTGASGLDVPTRVAPQLRVHMPDGVRTLPLDPTSRAADVATFTATLPLPASLAAPVRIDVIDDRGALLGTTHVEPLARPEPPPPPVPKREPPPPVLGAWMPMLGVSPVLDTLWLPPTLPNAAAAGAAIGRTDAGWVGQGQARVTGSFGPVGFDAALRSTAIGDSTLGSNGWAGVRMRVVRLEGSSFELAPAVRVGFPLTDAGPATRLEPSLAAAGALGQFSWLANAGLRLRLQTDDTATIPSIHGFLLAGATYEPISWLRLHSAVDAHLLQGDAVRVGFGLGLEAGGPAFVGATVRLGQGIDEGQGLFTGQLTLGLRQRAP
ncbi:uncharacterized protein CMC5_081510 [Chondromyces crocatus]|uniref:LysM domain-containing protein n=1 Tax=Chondromyces crocatus TaxID=52 RepID=A0A0K1ESY8_CHOCO|nr:uncharacterized protein CMC5_081510 [Chondromyces crocatus]